MSTEAINLINPQRFQSIEVTKKNISAFDWMFVILGGLPFYLPVLFFMGENGLSSQNPIYWYFWMSIIFSSPHVYSTYCRLGRKIQEKKVSIFIGWPAYVSIVLVLVIAQLKGFLLQAMTAVNVIQSYHYLRQVYGINRLYVKNPLESKLDMNIGFYAYHLAMPLFVFGRWDNLYKVWSGKPSTTIIPVDFSNTFMNFCWMLGIIALTLGIMLELNKFRVSPNSYNPTSAVILFVYFIIHWFGFLSSEFYQRGFFAITMFHAVQYLGLTWKMEWQSQIKTPSSAIKNIPFGIAFSLIWLAMFIFSYAFENKIVLYTNALLPNLAAIIVGGISAHHYFVDAFIWRKQAGQ